MDPTTLPLCALVLALIFAGVHETTLVYPGYVYPPRITTNLYPQGISLGFGTVTYPTPTDAELHCLFPPHEVIISNVVWRKVDNPFYYNYRGVSRTIGASSDLYIFGVGPQDYGVYRCTASAQRGGFTITVYQDVFLNNPLAPPAFYG